MSVAAAIGWGLALILFAVSLWLRRQRRRRSRFSTRTSKPVQPAARAAVPNAGEVLVYIEHDGSARALTEAEKRYVETEFSPLDGARPYIKSEYGERNAWGELRGYVHRERVPDGIPIGPTPPETPQPQTPEAVAESIAGLVRRHRPAGESKMRFKLSSEQD